MRNVKKIFFNDIKALLKHPFALIIAGGLCILPALYAWFNIYSNWDPYGNTGNIRVAVASKDRGYTDLEGSTVNTADAVIETLKENKSIRWVPVKTADAAIDGVYKGSYYAAVIFEEDFTQCMYHGFLEGFQRPTVTYYVNEKKNAVATKITDTAVSTLEHHINEQYITLIATELFHRQKTVANSVDQAELVDTTLIKLGRIQDRISHFSVLVRSLVQANDKLSAALEGAGSDLNTIRENLSGAQTAIENVPDTQALIDQINATNSQALQSVSQALEQLKLAQKADLAPKKEKIKERKNACYGQMATKLTNAKSAVDTLHNVIQAFNDKTMKLSKEIVLTQLEGQSQALESVLTQINEGIYSEDTEFMAETERQLEQQINSVQQALQTTVSQALAKLGSELQQIAAEISQVAVHAQEEIDLLSTILDQGVISVDLMNQGFLSMETGFAEMAKKLDQLKDVISKMSQAQLVEGFLSFIQREPEAYGTFFAEPVSISTETVYPVENYGSGVAPFYTTLALWVGGVVLVSLLKVKVSAEGLDHPRAHELFLGRYLIFLVLALMQAGITVWGNLYLLHIQCLYPRKFLLAAFLTSLTFSLLIYALTISFGDLGKALIVVLMVIQIAGSSGTYPIEILPEFYQRMYIFFPFPYAINAMREAVAGMYEHDYTLYLLKLFLFAAVALALGLAIRLPFRKFFQFVEQRMEDTEMM